VSVEYLVQFVDGVIDGEDVILYSGPFGDSDRQWHRAVESLMSYRAEGKKAWIVARVAPPWQTVVAPDERAPLDQPLIVGVEGQDGD
jgi:hypothetical protein